MMRNIAITLLVLLLVALYVLGHHQWHAGIVTVLNGITSFFTGTK